MPLFSHRSWGQQSGQSCQVPAPCAPLGNLGPPRARRVVGSVQCLALSWGAFGTERPPAALAPGRPGAQGFRRTHGMLPVGEPQEYRSGPRPARTTQPARKGLTVPACAWLEDA